MPAPTLTSSTTSTWSDNVNTDEVTGTLSWNAGDRILVIGMTEDQGFTLSTPTATGLTFSALGTAITTTDSCWLHAWQATAGSSGSGTITVARSAGTGVAMRGVAAFAYSGCTGFTRTNKTAVNSTKVVSVTRGQANSAVVFWAGDWSAGGTGGLGWTPSGQTQVIAQANSGATAFVARWDDQGATGTTNYGVTGTAGTAYTAAAVEVLGTVSSGTTVTPSEATAAAAANQPAVALAAAAESAGAVATANQPAPAMLVPSESAGAVAAAYAPTVATSGGGGGGTQSLFTSQTPTSTNNSDGTPGITVGVTLRFAVDGQVPGIRFFSTTTVGGTYTAAFYTVDSSDPGTGTALASKTMVGSPTPGAWNTINFDAPVSVTAGTAYRAAVFSSEGRYVATLNFFTTDLVNGDITADSHNDAIGGLTISQGTYRIDASIGYPNSAGGGGTNYFVDVVYGTGSAGTTVAVDCATAGATAYDPTVSTSTSTVAAAEHASAAAAALEPTPAVVIQVPCATAGASAQAPSIGAPGGIQHLFTSQTPAITDNADGAPGVTLGVTLRFAVDGVVSGIRFYSTATVEGTYSVALYQVQGSDPGSGTALASKTMAGLPSPSSWTSVSFDTPVSVTAGTAYRAAMHNTLGRYVATTGFFTTDLVNGDITADADGDTVGGFSIFQGTYRTGGPIEYPNSPASGGNYFVDVDYVTGGATVVEVPCATAGAEAFFDPGTSIALTLVADAPVDAAAVAASPTTAVVVPVPVATTAAAAYDPVASGVTATVVAVPCAIAGAEAFFDPGTSISVAMVADAPVEAAAGAYAPSTTVIVPVPPAVAGALGYSPAVAIEAGPTATLSAASALSAVGLAFRAASAVLSAASGLSATAFRDTRAPTVVLGAASSLTAHAGGTVAAAAALSAASSLVASATTSDAAPVIAYRHYITRTQPAGQVARTI